MGEVKVSEIIVTKLQNIDVSGGNVFHGMKSSDKGYIDFGEAYFSFIEVGYIKAWKKHVKMTLNLIVPIGKVKFVFIDSFGDSRCEIIGADCYSRLTVPPGIWFGFEGIFSPKSLILNIADIQHDPNEIKRMNIDEISYKWEGV